MTQRVPDAVIAAFARQQHDWMERVLKGSLDPHKVARAVQIIIDQQRGGGNTLRCISKNTSITIDDCDGSETLASAHEVFASSVDSGFKNLNINEPGIATKETLVMIHELVKDATFAQMFNSFGIKLDDLCLTQHQIKAFCKKYPNWLRVDDYATFFLFKNGNHFFVADVNVCADGLRVCCEDFRKTCEWVNHRLRVVVPQLTT